MWRLLQGVDVMRCAAAALLTFGLATTSAARAQVPTYSYADEPRVVVDPDERISGGAQVGAAFESAPGNPQLERLFVFFERSPILPLNVRLTSVDGRFLAEFPEGNWRPNESSSSSGCATRWQTSQCKAGGDRLCGWVELQLGDKVRSHLATRNQDEVAPLVVDGSGIAYPARWGACGEPDHVRLYINAEGARAFFVTADGTRDCAAASATSGFKYDRICKVPIDQVTKDRIYVLRKRGAGFSDPIEFDIALPRSP